MILINEFKLNSLQLFQFHVIKLSCEVHLA